MKNLYRKASLLLSIPFAANLAISVLIYLSGNIHLFKGYLSGTITSAGLSIIWLLQVKNKAPNNMLTFMKIMLKGYAVKTVFLITLLIGGYMLFHFDRLYFLIAFLLGTFASLFIEIWYYIAMIKLGND
jgi:hypothetical protein